METGSPQNPQPRTTAGATITPSVSARQTVGQELQGVSRLNTGQCPAMPARKPPAPQTLRRDSQPTPRALGRIQFSSPFRLRGGPGMLSRTSLAFWDFFTITSLSFTAVCILRTFDWFLGRQHTWVGAGRRDAHGTTGSKGQGWSRAVAQQTSPASMPQATTNGCKELPLPMGPTSATPPPPRSQSNILTGSPTPCQDHNGVGKKEREKR